jgi:hypothetical protein
MKLTKEQLEDLAHRCCTRFWHSPEPISTPHLYTFNAHHLLDLYRDILNMQQVLEHDASQYDPIQF